MTCVQIIITGENAVDAAQQYRNLLIAMQMSNPIPTDANSASGVVANKSPKKAAKAVVEEEDEDEAPKAKAKAKKAVVEEEEDEDEAPAPKKSKKPAVEEDEEEDEAPKAKAKKTDGKSSVGELKDDGKDQPATVDGCRIMVRRVARAHDTDYAQAVLAEFGVDGATKVPAKKMQAFIDRCQEVIDDPDSIEIAE